METVLGQAHAPSIKQRPRMAGGNPRGYTRKKKRSPLRDTPEEILMRPMLALLVLALAALPVRAHGPNDPAHQLHPLGDFQLESGEAIKDFSISYVTHGKLNEKKSNAI